MNSGGGDDVVIHGMHGAVLRISGGVDETEGVVLIRGAVFGTGLSTAQVDALVSALLLLAHPDAPTPHHRMECGTDGPE